MCEVEKKPVVISTDKWSKLPAHCGCSNFCNHSLLSLDHITVDIAGNWSTDWRETPCQRDANHLWSATIPLSPGVYEYKYIINGVWICDPTQPTVYNSFKTKNNVLEVPIDAFDVKIENPPKDEEIYSTTVKEEIINPTEIDDDTVREEVDNAIIKEELDNTTVEKEIENPTVKKDMEKTTIEIDMENTSVKEDMENTTVKEEMGNTSVKEAIDNPKVKEKMETTTVKESVENIAIEEYLKVSKLKNGNLMVEEMTEDPLEQENEPTVQGKDDRVEEDKVARKQFYYTSAQSRMSQRNIYLLKTVDKNLDPVADDRL